MENMSRNLIEYKKMSIFAMSLPLLKAPKGWKRARYIYIKGVTERFGFDVVESRKFKLIVKNKATGTLHGMIICNPNWLFLVMVILGCIIYSSAWGFQRCSFRQSGQCESLTTWNEHQTGSTFFCMC